MDFWKLFLGSVSIMFDEGHFIDGRGGNSIIDRRIHWRKVLSTRLFYHHFLILWTECFLHDWTGVILYAEEVGIVL